MTDKPILDLGALIGKPGQRPEVSPAEIVRAVDKIIREHISPPPEKALEPGDRFAQELRADSLDMVELVMTAEEQFHIEISDEEAEKVITISDAYELVERKVNHRG